MTGTDVLTADEAYAALPGISGGSKDADILMYASAVSRRLDQLCGYVVARAVVETHDGFSEGITLAQPVLSITSVTERLGSMLWTITDEATALGVYNYRLVGRTLYRREYGFTTGWCGGPASVTVTYSAGRAATTELVDPLIKLAARLWLQAVWRPAEGGGSATFGTPDAAMLTVTPDDVLGILGTERQAPVIG